MELTLDVEPGAATLSPAGEGHPAMVGFRSAGGEGPLGWQSKIPPGKGMGFSGASYVAGIAAAMLQHGADLDASRPEIWRLATELEGHPDNAAPSTFGGLTVSAAGKTVSVPLPDDLSVVAWIPKGEVSTNASRSTLPATVSHADAAHNVAHATMLVAGLATGDLDVLSLCTDRLHQPYRLQALPHTEAAIEAALAAGALTAFLSGSGPTAAALCRRADADRVAAAMPTEAAQAHTKVLAIGLPVRVAH